MTALEMYQEDLSTRRDPEKRKSRQEYFILLRDTLHEELAAEGRSAFLEEMMASCSGKAMPVLEFAAIRECFAAIVDGRRMKDPSMNVPHILRGPETPLAWVDLEQHPTFQVNDPQMPEMMVRLRNVSWQLVSARDQSPEVEAQRSVSRENAGLRALIRVLEANNDDLRAERDQLRARVTELEEGVISQQLQKKADARRYKLEEALAQEMAQKRRAAEEEIHAALRRAAMEEQQAREDARREAAQEDARRAAGYDVLLGKMQAALTQQMADFRSGLQETEYRFLAQCFADLEGLVSREAPGILGDAQTHGADQTLLERLAGFSGALNAQLTRMEQALLQLGLQVIQPRPGEHFDPALHSPAAATGDDAPEEERVIARVETPGIVRVCGDGRNAVLVRAVVHTGRCGEAAAATNDDKET